VLEAITLYTQAIIALSGLTNASVNSGEKVIEDR
jgi:hypothetical protein